MDKKEKQSPAKVHEELKGFDIKISPFGELRSNVSVDKINDFLDKNVLDKKLSEEEE